MRARLFIVLVLVSGTLAGVFAANMIAGAGVTNPIATVQLRERVYRFHGRVTDRRHVRFFTFEVPTAANVRARIIWGNSDARLDEEVHRGKRTLTAENTIRGSRFQIRAYGKVAPDQYLVRVESRRGSSHFRVVARATWSVTVYESSRPRHPIKPTATASPSDLPTASPIADPTTSNPISLFAQDWNGFAASRSQADWQAAAENNAVLVGPPGSSVYKMEMPYLRGWNPSLRILMYDLGPYTIKGSALYDDVMANHPGYFARDANGNLITVKGASGSSDFPNNYLMDITNPGWQQIMAHRVASNLARDGYDGVYLDSYGLGAINGSSVTGIPVDPASGTSYTRLEWASGLAQGADAVKAAIGDKFAFSSGLVNGYAYFSYTHVIADSALDGIMTDSWLRAGNTSPDSFPTVAQFQRNLDMVEDLQTHGKYLFAWTKVWTTATDAQKDLWNRFALATYLLVTEDRALYTFNPAFNIDRTTVWYSNERAALGLALGPYTVSNGEYTRQFEHGTVTVNPAARTASIQVS